VYVVNLGLMQNGRFVEATHGTQNGRDDVFISDSSVDHQVIERARRPVGAKVMFDEKHALAINGINQVFGIVQALSQILKTTEFVASRRVEKHVKYVWTFPQKIWRATANDHAIAAFG